eukprot:jgi/Undpi1/10881/HiC_scaffold_3.g01407.m1
MACSAADSSSPRLQTSLLEPVTTQTLNQDRPLSPKYVGANFPSGTTCRTGTPPAQPRLVHSAGSSSYGSTSTASNSSAADSIFGISEVSGSPRNAAARQARATAAGARWVSNSNGSHPQDQQQQQKQQRRRWWGRKVKGASDGSTSTIDTSFTELCETERKRKTNNVILGVGHRTSNEPLSGAAAAPTEEAAPAAAAAAVAGRGRVEGGGGGQAVPGSSMTNVRSRQPDRSRMVDKFEILDTLGVGYSGKVKRAVDTKTGQMVAIKVISKPGPYDLSSGKKFNRLQAEVQAMKMCGEHPHTVTLHDAKFNASYPKRDGTPEIADFGFAAIGETRNMCQSIVGSKTYMAPEVMGHQCNASHPIGYDGAMADVWSAGVILFTMLAGHSPMNRAHEEDWWFRALKLGREDLFWQSHERTVRPFPPDAKALVTAMLTVDPSQRVWQAKKSSSENVVAFVYVAIGKVMTQENCAGRMVAAMLMVDPSQRSVR